MDLRATGSQRYSSDEITAASGIIKGRDTSLDEVKAAAQKLLSEGVFHEVGYRHTQATGGMRVEFTVKDADLDQSLPADFDNIVWLPTAELETQIHQRLPLFKGRVPLNGTLGDEIVAALQEVLAHAGVKGHVSSSLHEIAGQPADAMRFLVDDMDIKVAQIGVTGASHPFDAEVQNEAAKVLNATYSQSQLRYFIAHGLRIVYLRHGYLKAEFGGPQPAVLSNDAGITRVKVIIPVTEGRQYKLAGLKWSGATVIPVAQLGSLLHLAGGVPVDGAQFEHDLYQIREQYARRGYMKAEVNALPNFDDAQGAVSYQLAVIEGPQYKMGKLDVEGLAKGSVERLISAWKLREGEPYDSTYVRNFLKAYQLPEGISYQAEQEVDDVNKIVDTTIVFRKER